jgi:predicted transcriptional regulator
VSFDLDRTTILLAIRPVYCDRILAGTKLTEFRRKPLPAGVERAILWRTGPGGGLVGSVKILLQSHACVEWCLHDSPSGERVTHEAAGVSAEDLIAYAGGPDAWVWALLVKLAYRYAAPIAGTALHPSLTRAPQSWRYAPAGWRAVLPEAVAA